MGQQDAANPKQGNAQAACCLSVGKREERDALRRRYLVGRVWQYRQYSGDGFTARYGVTKLVWYEQHEAMESAIIREKRIKKWNRAWKVELIEAMNPEWRDLWAAILD